MRIFFYCSYEHSQRGFYMTELKGEELVPAESLPPKAEEFFSFDRYKLLWCDTCSDGEIKKSKPTPDGAFFGMRNIYGTKGDGRYFIINTAFVAEEWEMPVLQRLALHVLSDPAEFERMLLSLFSIGGAYGYEVKAAELKAFVDSFGGSKHFSMISQKSQRLGRMLSYMQRKDAPSTSADLLRLAVYTSDKKDAPKDFGGGIAWVFGHPCNISVKEYNEIFIKNAPLWELG